MSSQTPRILGLFLLCTGCSNPWSATRRTSVGRELRVVTRRAPVDAWFSRFYGVQRALSLADRRRLASRLPLIHALHQLDDVRGDALAIALRQWFDAHPLAPQTVEPPDEVLPEAALVRWRDRLDVDLSDVDSDRALATLEQSIDLRLPRADGDARAMVDLVAQCLRRDISIDATMTALVAEATQLQTTLPAASQGVDATTRREFEAARDVLSGVRARAEAQRAESSQAAQRWFDVITPQTPEEAADAGAVRADASVVADVDADAPSG